MLRVQKYQAVIERMLQAEFAELDLSKIANICSRSLDHIRNLEPSCYRNLFADTGRTIVQRMHYKTDFELAGNDSLGHGTPLAIIIVFQLILFP